MGRNAQGRILPFPTTRRPYNAFIYLSTHLLARSSARFVASLRHPRVINRISRHTSLRIRRGTGRTRRPACSRSSKALHQCRRNSAPPHSILSFLPHDDALRRRAELREDLSVGISASSLCAELIQFDTAITQIEASRCPALLCCTGGETLRNNFPTIEPTADNKESIIYRARKYDRWRKEREREGR